MIKDVNKLSIKVWQCQHVAELTLDTFSCFQSQDVLASCSNRSPKLTEVHMANSSL